MLNTEWTQVEVIELLVDSTASLGFGMCGSKSTGIVIRQIYPGGAAEMDGRLRSGDHIICVQEFSLRGFGPAQVATLLRHTITTAAQAVATLPEGNDEPRESHSSRSPLQPSECHVPSDEESPARHANSASQSVPVRFIVARPAEGNPEDLQDAYTKQQKRLCDQQVTSTLGIVPTANLDEYVETLLQSTIPNSLTALDPSVEGCAQLTQPIGNAEPDQHSPVPSDTHQSNAVLEERCAPDVEDIFDTEPPSVQIGRNPGGAVEGSHFWDDPEMVPALVLEHMAVTVSQPLALTEDSSNGKPDVDPQRHVTKATKKSKRDPDAKAFETYRVELEREKHHNLGLTVVGYVYADPKHDGEYRSGVFVQTITPDSVAEMCSQIRENDQLIQVNDDVLLGLDNWHAVALLKRAENPVTLTLRRHTTGFLHEELCKANSKLLATSVLFDAPRLETEYLTESSRKPHWVNESAPSAVTQMNNAIEVPTIFETMDASNSGELHYIKSPLTLELTEDLDETTSLYIPICAPFKTTSVITRRTTCPESMKLLQRHIPLNKLDDFGDQNDMTGSTDTADRSIYHSPESTEPSALSSEEVHFICKATPKTTQTSGRSSSSYVRYRTRHHWAKLGLEYAGEVTPELEHLMRKVWQPLIDSDQEVTVVRIKKPRNATSLGFTIEGVDESRRFDPSSTRPVNLGPSGESRHFVGTIVPDGLIGTLDIIRPGDELLQVNGRRLRGTSHTNTIRCLRSLPTHIELVLARSKSGPKDVSLLAGVDTIAVDDEPPEEVLASEVNSVDTTYSKHWSDQVDSSYRSPASPRTSHSRVSDWIRRSVGELPVASTPSSHPMDRSHSLPVAPDVIPTTAPPGPNPKSHTADVTIARPNITLTRHTTGSKSMDQLSHRSLTTQTAGPVDYSASSSTMGRVDRFRLHDLRYGAKRPVWSDIPLLIQLVKTSKGFGFGLSEYAELEVVDTDSKTRHKSLTLGRRDRKKPPITGSTRLQRSATLPRSSSASSRIATSESKSGSRKRGYLLVDSISPDGAAFLDGRISLGDRLLFVNDRNLAKASLREAAAALRAAPNGPCLLGISKMHFKDNVVEGADSLSMPPLPAQEPITMAYEPLYVQTTGPTPDAKPDIDLTKYSDDHPLNFHILCTNFPTDLHAHDLIVPAMDQRAERTVRLGLHSRPIGIKLDAFAVGGQDGCRIVQVLQGGAVSMSHVLKPNDYITALDGHSLRSLTNVEAFEWLRHCSNLKDEIDIVYIPADAIETHRRAFLTLPQRNGLLNDANSPDPPARASPLSNCDKVLLLREPHEKAWGLELMGKELLVGTKNRGDPTLTNPTYVKSVIMGSSAARCGLIQPGDIILKVGDLDVSNMGAAETAEQLRAHVIAGTDTLEVCIRCGTSVLACAPGDGAEEIKRTFVVAEVEPPRRPRRWRHDVPNDEISKVGFRGLHALQPVSDTSMDYSQMDVPEPVSELESRDELYVLSSRPTAHQWTNGSHTDSGEEELARKLASLPCPVLTEATDVLSNATASPVASRPYLVAPLIPSPIDSDLDNVPIATDEPTKLYTRDLLPRDEILCLTIPFQLSESQPLPNLGVRLTGSCQADCTGTYVAGISAGSIAERAGCLRVGDEIVQVEQLNVTNSGHWVVQRCIIQALHKACTMSLNGNASLHLVVRRNPANLQQMSALNSSAEQAYAGIDFIDAVATSNDAHPHSTGTCESLGLIPKSAGDLLLSSPVCNGWLMPDPMRSKLLEQAASILDESPSAFDIFEVELHRNKDGFGLFLVNYGPDFKGGVFVSELAENGAAALQGELRPHDRILAVNGVLQTDYDTSLKLLKQCVPSVRLTIGRRKAPVCIVPGQETLIELLCQPDCPLGLLVVGGKGTALEHILVHSIREGGAVALDGRLAVGDHLLAVNDISLRDSDLATAKELLSSNRDRLQLLVYREPPPPPPPAAPTSPPPHLSSPNDLQYIDVTLRRPVGENLGLSLVSRSPYSTGTAIAAVAEGSSAAQSGQLLPGDVLMEINGIDVTTANVQEVMTLFKQSTEEVRLKVTRSVSSDLPSCPPLCPLRRLELYVVVLRRSDTLGWKHLDTNSSGATIGFTGPLLGSSNVEACFGLFLREASADEVLDGGGHLIVDDVLPGSPAALSIMITPGDRLLSIDREPVDWLQPHEVFDVLSHLTECTIELGRLPRVPYPVDPGLPEACYPNHTLVRMSSTPVSELPGIFMGEMPAIESSFAMPREMHTVCEEDMVLPTQDNLDDSRMPEQEDENMDNETQSDASDTVMEAIQIAACAGNGFQVRQLPLSPAQQPGERLGLRLTKGSGVSGVIVVHVQPNSPAAHSGLHVGDRILGLDSKLLLSLAPHTRSHELVTRIEELWSSRQVDTDHPVILTVISPALLAERKCNGLSPPSETPPIETNPPNNEPTHFCSERHFPNGPPSPVREDIPNLDSVFPPLYDYNTAYASSAAPPDEEDNVPTNEDIIDDDDGTILQDVLA